jgi:hypothetical protein
MKFLTIATFFGKQFARAFSFVACQRRRNDARAMIHGVLFLLCSSRLHGRGVSPGQLDGPVADKSSCARVTHVCRRSARVRRTPPLAWSTWLTCGDAACTHDYCDEVRPPSPRCMCAKSRPPACFSLTGHGQGCSCRHAGQRTGAARPCGEGSSVMPG